jgi:hemoglobin-like flavoprotein
VADLAGDPTPLVYARLFAAYPEMEALFVRDTTGAVRGEMLAMAFQCLLELDAPGGFAANLIGAERVNHEGVGVPPEVFVRFFPTVMETCRDLMGAEWTDEIDAAWRERLSRIAAILGVAQ